MTKIDYARIKQDVNIEDLLIHYEAEPLVKKGKDYVTHCPMAGHNHNDKNPSFHVRDVILKDKGITLPKAKYICYSNSSHNSKGESTRWGDIFDFVKRIELANNNRSLSTAQAASLIVTEVLKARPQEYGLADNHKEEIKPYERLPDGAREVSRIISLLLDTAERAKDLDGNEDIARRQICEKWGFNEEFAEHFQAVRFNDFKEFGNIQTIQVFNEAFRSPALLEGLLKSGLFRVSEQSIGQTCCIKAGHEGDKDSTYAIPANSRAPAGFYSHVLGSSVAVPVKDASGAVVSLAVSDWKKDRPHFRIVQNPLFDPSRTLFNLDRACDLSPGTSVWIAPSLEDVFAADRLNTKQASWKEKMICVCPFGNSLSRTQTSLLRRISARPVLVVSNTREAVQAACQNVTEALRAGIELDVCDLSLLEEHASASLAECIQKGYAAEDMQDLVLSARSFLYCRHYAVQADKSTLSPEDKAKTMLKHVLNDRIFSIFNERRIAEFCDAAADSIEGLTYGQAEEICQKHVQTIRLTLDSCRDYLEASGQTETCFEKVLNDKSKKKLLEKSLTPQAAAAYLEREGKMQDFVRKNISRSLAEDISRKTMTLEDAESALSEAEIDRWISENTSTECVREWWTQVVQHNSETSSRTFMKMLVSHAKQEMRKNPEISRNEPEPQMSM